MQEYCTDDIKTESDTSHNENKFRIFNSCSEISPDIATKSIPKLTPQGNKPLNRLQEDTDTQREQQHAVKEGT